MKELQDNIAAMNFTPQSKMGKMLMAKCRTLQEENEEIGNQASEGKVLPSLCSMPLIVPFSLTCVVLVTGSNVTVVCISPILT